MGVGYEDNREIPISYIRIKTCAIKILLIYLDLWASQLLLHDGAVLSIVYSHAQLPQSSQEIIL